MRYTAAIDTKNMTFYISPRNGEQALLQVSYAYHEQGIVRETVDHSARETMYELAPHDAVQSTFEPWKVEPEIPATAWKEVYAI